VSDGFATGCDAVTAVRVSSRSRDEVASELAKQQSVILTGGEATESRPTPMVRITSPLGMEELASELADALDLHRRCVDPGATVLTTRVVRGIPLTGTRAIGIG
jgi:hypothetical protein